MRQILIALLFAGSMQQAWAQTSLSSEGVFAAEPAEATSNVWGVVLLPGSHLPGTATLSDSGAGSPSLRFLGCSFDVQPEPDSAALARAAPAFSRKLTTRGDPPPAGFGMLVNPKPVGLTDPLTSIKCSSEYSYFFFLFRQTPMHGDLEIETLVLEVDAGGRDALFSEQFDPDEERMSVQVRELLRVASGFYRMSFRTPEDAVAASKQAEQQQQDLVKLLLFVAPKALGLPFR